MLASQSYILDVLPEPAAFSHLPKHGPGQAVWAAAYLDGKRKAGSMGHSWKGLTKTVLEFSDYFKAETGYLLRGRRSPSQAWSLQGCRESFPGRFGREGTGDGPHDSQKSFR